MAVFVCGDTHIPIDVYKLNVKSWPEQKSLTKDDKLVIVGDCGLLWEQKWSKEELYWANWLTRKRCTVCFLDGNHENFSRINRLETVDFCGGKAGLAYCDEYGSIVHLRRGEIYTFEGASFFIMGGAKSTDKIHRTAGLSWWPNEIPSYAEIDYALANLERNYNNVDYILTHTCPNKILDKLFGDVYSSKDSTRDFLDVVNNRISFRRWFFGHFHTDVTVLDKFTCLYEKPPMRIL